MKSSQKMRRLNLLETKVSGAESVGAIEGDRSPCVIDFTGQDFGFAAAPGAPAPFVLPVADVLA